MQLLKTITLARNTPQLFIVELDVNLVLIQISGTLLDLAVVAEIPILDNVSGVVDGRHFLILISPTPTVGFSLLFDEMISSKVEGHEHSDDYHQNNPNNLVSREGLLDAVGNIGSHGSR